MKPNIPKLIPTEERCQVRVSGEGRWGTFHQHQCEKKAIVVKDGKRYCTIHSPDYTKAKAIKKTVEFNKMMDKCMLEIRAPMLLKACKDALEVCHDPKVEKILMEAIAKVEGK